MPLLVSSGARMLGLSGAFQEVRRVRLDDDGKNCANMLKAGAALSTTFCVYSAPFRAITLLLELAHFALL